MRIQWVTLYSAVTVILVLD